MEIFYSNNIEGNIVTLSAEESTHCVKVLRHKLGDTIMLCSGEGFLYSTVIIDINSKAVKLQIESIDTSLHKHGYFLHLAVAPTKNIDRFEWFLEKATELGINKITPILCEHSERKVIKEDRSARVILAAAKQSLKTILPEFSPLCPFSSLIESSKDFEGIKLIACCDESIPKSTLSSILSELFHSAKKSDIAPRALCLIGPEGDFSSKEVQKAIEAGFLPVSLGESRLRTETAAVYVAAACNYND